jgi:hypothetical protein
VCPLGKLGEVGTFIPSSRIWDTSGLDRLTKCLTPSQVKQALDAPSTKIKAVLQPLIRCKYIPNKGIRITIRRESPR